MEQVDREKSSARSFLALLAQVQSRPSSIADSQASEQRREKEQAQRDARRQKERIEAEIKKKREELKSQEKQLKSAEEEVKKRRQELEAEIEAELGIGEKDYEENFASRGSAGSQEIEEITAKAAQPQARRPANKAHGDESMKQLERIRIPVFAGNKMNFQRWHAAFTFCVDQTPLTPQFKMLRLEACLVGEAAETIKGLGYSLEAYEVAKARLVRKYGGSRRQVQTHLEELKKVKPLRDNNAKELETFADVLERAVITLKENGHGSDLEGGTLYTIILEKIPERLLTQYYRWLKEHSARESLEVLKDWIAEEAEYQTQASEIKHGFTVEPEERYPTRRHLDSRHGRSYVLTERNQRERACRACSGKHPIWKYEIFGGWTAQRRWDFAKKCGLCFRGEGYFGKTCSRDRGCTVKGCKKSHHSLLHYETPRSSG